MPQMLSSAECYVLHLCGLLGPPSAHTASCLTVRAIRWLGPLCGSVLRLTWAASCRGRTLSFPTYPSISTIDSAALLLLCFLEFIVEWSFFVCVGGWLQKGFTSGTGFCGTGSDRLPPGLSWCDVGLWLHVLGFLIHGKGGKFNDGAEKLIISSYCAALSQAFWLTLGHLNRPHSTNWLLYFSDYK